MNKYLPAALVLFIAVTLPRAFAHAATGTVKQDLIDLRNFISDTVVPLIFAIAFIVFIWGIFQYFIAGGANEEKRKQGQQLALWGLIGFVLMFSVWGIIKVAQGSLGLDSGTPPPIPSFNTTSTSNTNNDLNITPKPKPTN